MADNAWSQSGCCCPARPDVWWYGVPGQGSHLWTARFGQYWVGGGIYQKYAQQNYECGGLGLPVKAYQWLSEFGAYGQWFEGGAIYYSGGQWRMVLGNYGQTAGRLTTDAPPPADAERPPEHDELVIAGGSSSPAPRSAPSPRKQETPNDRS